MKNNHNIEYLKFYIDSKCNDKKIEEFIKTKNITLDEFYHVINNCIDYLKKESIHNGKINKVYLEYCLKYNDLHKEEERTTKIKEKEKIINIIKNYISDGSHNIKEYVSNNNLKYSDFKRFINNSKKYFLTDKEKQILKQFLKIENDFNKDNIDKVKYVINKISEDLVNDRPYNIYNYYIDLGWDYKLLIFYLNNNKDLFSNFVIDNVKIYFKKYHIDDKEIKHSEFIDYIKKENPELKQNDIDNIINKMNKLNMPNNYYLFNTILNRSE